MTGYAARLCVLIRFFNIVSICIPKHSLGYRDRTLLEKRNAVCMTCGRVSSPNIKLIFDELSTMFEGSGADGAEKPTVEPWKS